ncbi:MAG TPA: GntR family transcriptional regulator [Clostridia bacterium]|nr:GntR family transcriptional regulator [Clostridia bacterium]
MRLDFSNEKSIYLQIAENIEDDILKGAIAEEAQIPSTNQMAVLFKINPATAGKGINLLVEEGILYKKRGIGMFVAAGAKKQIAQKRKSGFYDNYIAAMLEEAKNIGITRNEIIEMISREAAAHE